jgi:amino acid permease
MVGALALLLLLCPARGWAYIDPNAGGFLAQMIAPLIAVGASFLFYCRKQLARYFKSGTRKVEQQELRAEPDSQSRD